MSFLAKTLCQGPKREAGPGVDLLVGCFFAKLRDERLLQLAGKREATY